jgi:hypothetical protein
MAPGKGPREIDPAKLQITPTNLSQEAK